MQKKLSVVVGVGALVLAGAVPASAAEQIQVSATTFTPGQSGTATLPTCVDMGGVATVSVGGKTYTGQDGTASFVAPSAPGSYSLTGSCFAYDTTYPYNAVTITVAAPNTGAGGATGAAGSLSVSGPGAVHLSSSGFTPGETVNVTVHYGSPGGRVVATAKGVADAAGVVAFTVDFASGWPAGSYYVEFKGATSGVVKTQRVDFTKASRTTTRTVKLQLARTD